MQCHPPDCRASIQVQNLIVGDPRIAENATLCVVCPLWYWNEKNFSCNRFIVQNVKYRLRDSSLTIHLLADIILKFACMLLNLPSFLTECISVGPCF